MKSRPILFSAPMVRAILAGTKTQTRRIIKPQPRPDLAEVHGGRTSFDAYEPEDNETGLHLPFGFSYDDFHTWCCPYGQPGDRLWVRETWAGSGNEDGHPIDAAGNLCEGRDAERFYRADVDGYEYGMAKLPGGRHFDGRWTPSIHMPRWASRITLEITGVRVERLQEITADDCRAEGCPPESAETEPRYWYYRLWDKINGPGSWDANPWVWVVSFRRTTDGAAMPANAKAQPADA